jgi:hypothetical protein
LHNIFLLSVFDAADSFHEKHHFLIHDTVFILLLLVDAGYKREGYFMAL